MARKVLTDANISALSTSKPNIDVWHKKWMHRGSFGLRVSRTGRKVWIYRENLQRDDGRTRTISHRLGQYPDLTLAEAMETAYQLARVSTNPASPTYVRDLEPIMLDRYERSGASAVTVKRRKATMRTMILPAVGDMRIRDVRTSHLQEIIDQEERAGKFGNAADAKATLGVLFKPVMRLDAHFFNPARDLELTPRDRRSQRVKETPVDMQVLVDVWRAAEELWRERVHENNPGAAVRFLIIQMQIACCQRTRVMMEIDRECIGQSWWVHPGRYTDTKVDRKSGEEIVKEFRTKNAKPMGVPLLPLIRGRLDKILGLVPPEQRFLTARFRDWWPSDIFYQRIMLDIRDRSGRERDEWWPHRARSVYYTLMTRAGHDVMDVSRVASHSGDAEGGPQVARYYIEPRPRDPVVKKMLEHWNAMLVEALDVHESGEPISAVL